MLLNLIMTFDEIPTLSELLQLFYSVIENRFEYINKLAEFVPIFWHEYSCNQYILQSDNWVIDRAQDSFANFQIRLLVLLTLNQKDDSFLVAFPSHFFNCFKSMLDSFRVNLRDAGIDFMDHL